ncbi:MAG: hypothetical protein GX304_01900 [Clostridiales bacterium]|jgi:hypothetical protein|nr:hypothetical protein [Clostridiales bacterium]
MVKHEDKGIKAIILILLLAAAMAAGGALFGKGAADWHLPKGSILGIDKGEVKRRVFVSGAVQREDFYEVSADMTYRELFALTGLYTVSDISAYDFDRYVDITQKKIILGYFEGGMLCPSLDINSAGEAELLLLGLEEGEARSLIEGRPYKRRDELLSKGILSGGKFSAIEHKIFAGQGE